MSGIGLLSINIVKQNAGDGVRLPSYPSSGNSRNCFTCIVEITNPYVDCYVSHRWLRESIHREKLCGGRCVRLLH